MQTQEAQKKASGSKRISSQCLEPRSTHPKKQKNENSDEEEDSNQSSPSFESGLFSEEKVGKKPITKPFTIKGGKTQTRVFLDPDGTLWVPYLGQVCHASNSNGLLTIQKQGEKPVEYEITAPTVDGKRATDWADRRKEIFMIIKKKLKQSRLVAAIKK